MANCGVTCLKYTTFLCNLLFAIKGLLVFLFGLLAQLKYNHYSNFVGEKVSTIPIILMTVGLLVTVICFLGCCGAIKEKSCMILSFAVLAVIIFISEIGLGVAGYVQHSGLKAVVEEHFNTTMHEYNDRKDVQDAWSLVQTELFCCGTYEPSDWEHILPNSTLPPSCCAVIKLDEASDCTIKHAHPDGCFKKVFAIIDANALTLVGVVLGMALIQILTIASACYLYRAFGRNYEAV